MARKPKPALPTIPRELAAIKGWFDYVDRELKSLGAGVDLSDIEADIADHETRIDALEAATSTDSTTFSFHHPPQTSGSSATRHMFPGYSNTNWTTTVGYPNVVVPADGTLSLLTARHTAATTAETDTLTYEVLLTSAGGNPSSPTVTSLTVTIQGDDGAASRDTANTVNVSAGDLVGIRFTCSSAISNMPNAPGGGGHWASVVFTRSA